ncbi:uncharacterized protein J3R85_006660 [Psidium guajava]|nr:uncharacterized protein J3R85_006660 [Psidium guajava]
MSILGLPTQMTSARQARTRQGLCLGLLAVGQDTRGLDDASSGLDEVERRRRHQI